MKKGMMVLVTVAMILVAAAANAEVKDLEIVPRLIGDNVSFSLALPGGTGALNVIIYDDEAGSTPNIVRLKEYDFFLKPGQGFNLQWIDPKGITYWQLVTPTSPVGPGLAIACGSDGCKYVRPKQ